MDTTVVSWGLCRDNGEEIGSHHLRFTAYSSGSRILGFRVSGFRVVF